MTLSIKDLHVEIDGKEILKGLNLEVKAGEMVALMGPNGSGKSTLSNCIMGHPDFIITQGSITYHHEEITQLSPEERAHKGIFLSFQHPVEVPGLLVKDYLREILKAKTGEKISLLQFRKLLSETMNKLHIKADFAERYLNQGFSGGEKKRMEILQMALLKPSLAVLDETDSGLDIDALRKVAEGVNTIKEEQENMGVLIITHYKRILEYLKPDRVVVLVDGKIIKEGGPELVDKLEEEGYAWAQEM